MRILLDECLPRRLREQFPADFVVKSVPQQGWSGKRNGELMRLAESQFDTFVTMDRSIEYQQNLAGFELSVILLRAVSNRFADLVPLMPELLAAIESTTPGRLRQVPNA